MILSDPRGTVAFAEIHHSDWYSATYLIGWRRRQGRPRGGDPRPLGDLGRDLRGGKDGGDTEPVLNLTGDVHS